MPVEVILPKVDMDMTHGTLAVWHVAEGDMVAKGAPLFDIETDKAAMEVEAPATGRLRKVTARPGDKVAVGSVIGLIFAEGEVPDTAPTTSPTPASSTAPVPASAPAPVPVPVIETMTNLQQSMVVAAAPRPDAKAPDASADAVRATPAARAAARSAGLKVSDVGGTGPKGRVQRDDVTTLVKAKAIQPAMAGLAAPLVWLAEPGPLHVTARAGTGIPILMIHGFTADSQSWAPLEKALGRDRALIRIDLPGHGRSPKRQIANFAELARMLAEAFDDATRGHESVHLLGHSLGAALALAIADIRARKLASLSLIAPAGLGPEIDAAALMGIVRASRVESLAPWLRRLTATPAGISDDYAKAAMRLRTDPLLRAAQADLAGVLFPDGVQSFDLRPALGRLTLPTCIIWGRQDHILPTAQATATPHDAALHLLQGAGHVPHLECPERVAPIIARHIRADL